MSIEYSTMPRTLTGASPISVITAFRGSEGSSSPKAVPRSFSCCPTEPKDSPPNVGDWDRAGSMRILRIPETEPVGLVSWASLNIPPGAAMDSGTSLFRGRGLETRPIGWLKGMIRTPDKAVNLHDDRVRCSVGTDGLTCAESSNLDTVA